MVSLTHCPHCHRSLTADRTAWADRVRAVRKAHGLTQQQFANTLGVSMSAIQKWEAGIAIPGEESAYRIERLETSPTN